MSSIDPKARCPLATASTSDLAISVVCESSRVGVIAAPIAAAIANVAATRVQPSAEGAGDKCWQNSLPGALFPNCGPVVRSVSTPRCKHFHRSLLR
jgi:hypothetical protein